MKKIAVIVIAVLFSLVGFKYASAQNKVAAATKCTFSISPSSNTFPSGGGSGGVSITTQDGCAWKAKSNASWITVSPGSGTGNGSIFYVVTINNGKGQRTGTITIAGKSFKIVEAGDPNSPIVFKLPTALPNACLDGYYEQQVPAATGGLGTFHYQLDTGGFPPMGLILSPDGVISGMASSPGTYRFKVCAVDAGGYSKCDPTSITVSKTPCCSTPHDICVAEGLCDCGTMYSCANASGIGYYKAGGEYFCCDGNALKGNLDCSQAANAVVQFCCPPPTE